MTVRTWRNVGSCAFCCLIFIAVNTAQGAEFSIVSSDLDKQSPTCTISMNGVITEGDTDKLKALDLKLFRDFPEKEGWPGGIKLCLNSSGGSFREALNIAKEIVASDITTVIQPMISCLTTCGIVFIAGGYSVETAYFSNRYLHRSGRLSLSIGSPEENQGTYATAIGEIGELIGLRKGTNSTVIPVPLLIRLLSSFGGPPVAIETVSDALRADITVFGIAVPKAVNTTTLCNACFNFFSKFWGEFDPEHYRGICSKTQITRTTKRGLLIAGFGAEGMGGCLVRSQLTGYQLYTNVVWKDEPLDPSLFIKIKTPWYFDPAELLSNLH